MPNKAQVNSRRLSIASYRCVFNVSRLSRQVSSRVSRGCVLCGIWPRRSPVFCRQLLKMAHQAVSECRIARGCGRSMVDHNVVSGGLQITVGAKKFARNAFDPVSIHGPAGVFFRNGQANTGIVRARIAGTDHKVLIAASCTTFEHSLKISAGKQA